MQRSLLIIEIGYRYKVMLQMLDTPQGHDALSFGGALAEGVARLVLEVWVERGLAAGLFETTTACGRGFCRGNFC